ncbi:D-alanyl-D-alanine carboxypeptidase family protein [Solimonas terrae]|uniref:D-alanyl-D-alanine carboxypeptidase n=1 Tax=Solimonas terrae TaxID=1396819 RepID=A0A6M2BSA5_9GAMM|nr:serine hydrolase [Solimonas terrae]NGY05234.1 D-alanyl-D-alanine carboxypeptidase [Solimonas terrae]
MTNRRRGCVVAVAALMLSLSAAAAAPVADRYPGLAAAHLLMRDDAVVSAHAADTRRPMASLTKLMTALLAVESGRDDGEAVTVTAAAARETGTRLGLSAGQRLRFGDLLAATLIGSDNDACHALADALAGSEAAFVARMNARARELGLVHTHYENACGHDASAHVSTARELAALALVAIQQPRILVRTSQPEAAITTLDATPRTFRFGNHNELIGRYPGAIGIKSGTTPAAGRCLVAYAQRDGHAALLVLLDARERWWTATRLLDDALGGNVP